MLGAVTPNLFYLLYSIIVLLEEIELPPCLFH